MSRSPRLARALLVAGAALALLASPGAIREARAGWWDDLDKGESVRLADLVAEPRRWKDKVVTFSCIYHGPDQVFQPYFTSFTPDKFLNFTAWIDGAPLWELKSYTEDDFPFLYVRRDHPQRDSLGNLLPFTRIEVTGRVKDVYRERPWIEVLGFRATPATLGRHVVDWVKDADAYAVSGDLARAETYYRRALAEVTLAETYQLRLRKRLSDVLRAAGRELDAAKVEGGSPIVGGTVTPAASAGHLNPTTSTPTGEAPAAPPAPLTTDLPGTAYAAPDAPRVAAPVGPAPVGASPAGVRAPSGAPPTPLTTDLPGADYGTPRPAASPPPAPLPIPTAPSCPTPSPEGAAPAPAGRSPADTAAGAPNPPAPPPPTPAPTDGSTVASTGADPEGEKRPAGPPPVPPRTPRMTGVR